MFSTFFFSAILLTVSTTHPNKNDDIRSLIEVTWD